MAKRFGKRAEPPDIRELFPSLNNPPENRPYRRGRLSGMVARSVLLLAVLVGAFIVFADRFLMQPLAIGIIAVMGFGFVLSVLMRKHVR